jgi:hypothetical protein
MRGQFEHITAAVKGSCVEAVGFERKMSGGFERKMSAGAVAAAFGPSTTTIRWAHRVSTSTERRP